MSAQRNHRVARVLAPGQLGMIHILRDDAIWRTACGRDFDDSSGWRWAGSLTATLIAAEQGEGCAEGLYRLDYRGHEKQFRRSADYCMVCMRDIMERANPELVQRILANRAGGGPQ